MDAYTEQAKKAREYNNAFLHGKEVGLKFGREIAINDVLAALDECKFKDDKELYPYDCILWHNKALEMAKQAVLDLK